MHIRTSNTILYCRKWKETVAFYRDVLKLDVHFSNDWFVEFDYNGAEIRTLLSLAGKEQPEEDIHEFHMSNIYKNITSRPKAKENILDLS